MTSPSLLRPEGRPVSWAQLTPDEKIAFLQVATLIKDCLPDGEADDTRTVARPPYPPLDKDRKNQVVLLSGERGTGKTTLMLSLMEACNKSFDESDLDEDSKRMLSRLRKGVVWLYPLDLEPLPDPTNLLASILTRVEDAATDMLGKENWCAPTASMGRGDLLPRGSDYFQYFNEVKRDVAMSWDGNLKARGAHVDPEPFGEEVLQAERAHLFLNHRFAKALRGLGKRLVETGKYEDLPLFVLPIDDFDMNPARCVEMLRLLRMISAPRLFTLILGDMKCALDVATLHFVGEFSSIAGIRASAEPSHPDPGFIWTRAQTTAANALRKLIPPAQVFYLRPLDIAGACGFKPEGQGESVGQLLSEIDLPEFGAPLADFLGLSTDGPRWYSADPPWYSAAPVLAAPARHLVDLWYMLKRVGRDCLSDPKKFRAIDDWLEREVKAYSGEFDGVTGHEADVLLVPRTGSMETIRLIDLAVKPRSLKVTPWLGWSGSDGKGSAEPPASSPGWANPWRILRHDIRAIKNGDNTGSAQIRIDPLNPGLVAADWLDEEDEPRQRFSWPLPAWNTIREHDLFRQAWMSELRSISPSILDASHLVCAWIRSILASFGKKASDPADEPHVQAEQLARATLDLIATASIPEYQMRAWKSWIVNLALLLSPESGTPREIAEPFTRQVRIVSCWVEASQARLITGIRRRRMLQAGDWKRIQHLLFKCGALEGIWGQVDEFTARWNELPQAPSECPAWLEEIHAGCTSMNAKWPEIRGSAMGDLVSFQPRARTRLNDGLSRNPGPFETHIRELLDIIDGLTSYVASIQSPHWSIALSHPINTVGGGCLRPILPWETPSPSFFGR